MTPWAPAATILLLSFAVAVAVTPLIRAAARRLGFLDRPNPRSSHQRVVPRGGGAAIVLASLVALSASPLARAGGATLLGAGVALALVGLWDDRFGLPPLPRLAFQMVAALAAVWGGAGIDRLPLPPPLDLPLHGLGGVFAVLWIVAVVNFYNFLDGIDGLAALQGVVTGLGLVLAGWDPVAAGLGAAIAGACLGFLLFNWSPATIFMGDIGSCFLGYTLSALPLLAPADTRPRAVMFVALSLWLFLADATWTLARRLARGERFYEAHREHLYQRLALRFGHGWVAAGLGLGSCALTVIALQAWRSADAVWAWTGLTLALLFFAAEGGMAGRREPR
ncbi:MAG TPA: glycosyltransferase family 4 protein [Vicinamibacteria bacterium]|nr:glycosyltransferase family 4 protein [Vicinamibacteria bacterium]